MEEHYCDKCFKKIKTGMEHQDWCPKKIDVLDFENINDDSPLKGTIFEDLMNNQNKDD